MGTTMHLQHKLAQRGVKSLFLLARRGSLNLYQVQAFSGVFCNNVCATKLRVCSNHGA